MFCPIMPHTLLQLPHSLFELSVKAQLWKLWQVQHGENQRIRPRKPCNPASSQIYTWSNLSFSWFISLAVLCKMSGTPDRKWRSHSHVRHRADLQHLDVTADQHPPPIPKPPLSNPPCGCLPAHRHWRIEWAIYYHPGFQRGEKHCLNNKTGP